jgi:hypothetical protein
MVTQGTHIFDLKIISNGSQTNRARTAIDELTECVLALYPYVRFLLDVKSSFLVDSPQ